ncbi:hypothetical protein RIR_jg22633.t1 [Rhizophagus irregularis DAOM 181602=DAOM 197198]|nr:hypothetical protein RIR_jg22633.t1 [Rhizophagus irregularis DAOM 181602=DAOM 197198]
MFRLYPDYLKYFYLQYISIIQFGPYLTSISNAIFSEGFLDAGSFGLWISGHAGKFDERLLISKHWNHKIWLNLDFESWVLASYF